MCMRIRLFAAALFVITTSSARADDFLTSFTYSEGTAVFAELRCARGGAVIRSEWQQPQAANAQGAFHLSPSSFVRNGGRLMFDFDTNYVAQDVPIDVRTADCKLGNHNLRARLLVSEIQTGGRHDRKEQAHVRLWLDGRQINRAVPVDDVPTEAKVDLAAKTIHVCTIAGSGMALKTTCETVTFDMGQHDDAEFGAPSRLLGKNHDVVVIEATDTTMCRSFGDFIGAGPRPTNLKDPTEVAMPEAWRGQAGKAYRFDVDNDGEVEDVVVLQVDQYILFGSILAMFDADSVLSEKTTLPGWTDLLELAMNPQNHKGPEPEHFQNVVWGGDLGILGDSTINLYLIDGKTYAHVAPFGVAWAKDGEQDVLVRLQPGLFAEQVCTFTRRR
jgi:hypothetical protein